MKRAPFLFAIAAVLCLAQDGPQPEAKRPTQLTVDDERDFYRILAGLRTAQASASAVRLSLPAELLQRLQAAEQAERTHRRALSEFITTRAGESGCELDGGAQWKCPESNREDAQKPTN